MADPHDDELRAEARSEGWAEGYNKQPQGDDGE